MLASVALVGCTDDDLLNGVENQEMKKMDTYISISVEASNNSSRAITNGDKDQTTDDSGHHNNGVGTENNVNEMLIIVTPSDNNIAVTADGTINGFVKTLTTGFSVSNGVYSIAENSVTGFPVRVDYMIPYKALVVLNPTTALKTAIGGLNHKQAYNKVCEFDGAGYEEINKTSTSEGGETTTTTELSFMMSNKSEVIITPTEANQTEATPAKETIEVERAVSKVTFRPSAALSAVSSLGENTHEITVNVTNYVAVSEQYWYLETYQKPGSTTGETVEKYTYAMFNKASHSTDGEVWVLLEEGAKVHGGQVDINDVIGIFTKGTATHEGYVETTPDNPATTDENEQVLELIDTSLLTEKTFANDAAMQTYLNAVTFTVGEGTPGTAQKFYVHLENYALTNLSKTVYAVRHVAKGGSFTNVAVPGGALTHNVDYIVDPKTEKYYVGETLTNGKNYWTNGASTEAWFNQTLSAIIANAETFNSNTTETLPVGWAALPTSENAPTDGVSNTAHGNVGDVGYFMDYCYENVVKADMQKPELVTGLVVSGQIYEADGRTKVPVMYKYNDNFYRTLKQLLEANSEITGVTENMKDEDIPETSKIQVYKGGKCFYYSSQIEHFDNDAIDAEGNLVENGAGIMENAIMRNNIYSLSISGVRNIGSSTLELAAGAGVADKSAFITVKCSILPWIVRFNDLEL